MRIDGLDIPVSGVPEQAIVQGAHVSVVALLGNDYQGLSPAILVSEGDRVKTGQPLFEDRKYPRIKFTSPGSGTVSQINRGARRRLLSVVVALDGDDAETFPSWSAADLAGLRRDQVADVLLASGLWTAFRARPYAKVPDPGSVPHSIFVTAVDTNPLAARPEVIIGEYPEAFGNGLTVISRLTEGPVFVCRAPYVELPKGTGKQITEAEFAGPHPSGLVGTHIHFLDPVSARRTVWHLNYQDVIAIGKLMTSGQLWTTRIVSLAGPVVKRPRLVRTRLGAETDALCRGELEDTDCRVISGSVLSGRAARAPENYLGRYHHQISVIAEQKGEGQTPWLGAARDAFSVYGVFSTGRKRLPLSSAMHGSPGPMVAFGAFERVMPLDILPTQLMRALLVGDTDMAQALGCLELEEEDLALCSFVCPSKLNYGLMLRSALSQIEKEG
jgi:Na+-transporting NADH:ubiquinone oxidoreductase subunit A